MALLFDVRYKATRFSASTRETSVRRALYWSLLLMAALGTVGYTSILATGDLAPLERLTVLDGHTGRARAISFACTGDVVASVTENGPISLWNPRSGELLCTLGSDGGYTTVTFWPLIPYVLAAGRVDGTIEIWDISTEKMVRSIDAHDRPVRQLAFSYLGDIASAANDGKVKLWNGLLSWRLEETFNIDCSALAFSPDGTTLAIADANGTVTLRPSGQSLTTTKSRSAMMHMGGDRIVSLWFSPDGSKLASLTMFGVGSTLWSTATGEIIDFLPLYVSRTAVLSPNLDTFAMPYANHGDLVVVVGATNRAGVTHFGNCNWQDLPPLAFSCDGTMLAVGCSDGTIIIWDTSSIVSHVSLPHVAPTPISSEPDVQIYDLRYRYDVYWDTIHVDVEVTLINYGPAKAEDCECKAELVGGTYLIDSDKYYAFNLRPNYTLRIPLELSGPVEDLNYRIYVTVQCRGMDKIVWESNRFIF